jgi:hypothetical protein
MGITNKQSGNGMEKGNSGVVIQIKHVSVQKKPWIAPKRHFLGCFCPMGIYKVTSSQLYGYLQSACHQLDQFSSDRNGDLTTVIKLVLYLYLSL